MFAVDSGTAVDFLDWFCFPLSVWFHQTSIFIFNYILLLPEKQTVEVYRPSKKQRTTNYCHFLFKAVTLLEQEKLSFILNVFCHKLQWIIGSTSFPILFSSYHVPRQQIPSLKVRHTHCACTMYSNSKDTICLTQLFITAHLEQLYKTVIIRPHVPYLYKSNYVTSAAQHKSTNRWPKSRPYVKYC